MAHVMNLVMQDVASNISECRNFTSPIRDLMTLDSQGCFATVSCFQLQFLEDLSSENTGDASNKANGLLQHQQKFSTFFSLKLMLTFFLPAETANVALQNSQLHSQKAFQLIEMLRKHIKHLHGNGFEDFWKSTNAAANLLNVEEPVLPRPRKNPRRVEDGGAPSHSFQSAGAMYRFYQVMDTATTSLDCRFSQSAFKRKCNTEDFVTGKSDCEMIWIKAG